MLTIIELKTKKNGNGYPLVFYFTIDYYSHRIWFGKPCHHNSKNLHRICSFKTNILDICIASSIYWNSITVSISNTNSSNSIYWLPDDWTYFITLLDNNNQ